MQLINHATREGSSSTRRSLLGRAAGITAAAAAGVTLLSRPSWARFRYVPYYDPIEDQQTLNFLLMLERLKAAFYAANADKPYLGGGLGVSTLQSLVDEIRSHDNAHVSLLEQTLGAKADPAPSFQALDAPSLDQYLQMALSLEDLVASGYVTVLPVVHDIQLRELVADLSSVDARHAGGLRAYLKGASSGVGGDPNIRLTEGGDAVNLYRTRDQVLASAKPFLGP
jgi:hypothetical protein